MQRDVSSPAPAARDAGRLPRLAVQQRSLAAWIGPLSTAAAVAVIVLARPFVTISSPGLVLLVFVALSAVLAGAVPALASSAIVTGFVVLDVSADGQPFVYDAAALSRVVVNAATAIVMALLVGGIQQRLQGHQAVVARQRSEDRQRALTDSATEAILTIDADSTILVANPATAELFGHPVETIVGQPITMLMPPELRTQHLEAFARYLRTGRRTIPWQGAQLRALHASGREFPIEVSIGEYGSGADRRFTGIVRDITRRKDIEAQLIQAQKMDAIGRLAGGVAHDFNNLLTAIGGYAEMVGSSLERDDARQAHVAGIRQAVDHAASLTRQLLAFSRSQELSPTVVDLGQVVTSLTPMLQRLLGERIKLLVQPTEDPCRVMADRSQLQAILVNLAVNARDAMPDGGTLTIETATVELDEAYQLQHTAVAPGHYAMLVVSDNGVGMDDETLAHVFEPFFTTKPAGSGTGLGLATVYGTVKQSGGSIFVYSEPGHGTTFKVYLPRTDATDTAPTQPEEARPPDVVRSGHETILVAEDEAVVRDMVVAALERTGYRVVVASTGEEAVRLIDRMGEEIDLLLSDVVMPGMSGPDLYDRARRTRPDLRAIFMSGYTALAIGRPIPAGITLIEKPFSAARLNEAVRQALAGG